MGCGRGDGRRPSWSSPTSMEAWPRDDGGRDGAVAAQRAGRDRGPQDHVVRRERRSRWPTPAEQGATEAIFANTAGNLCEGTGSNVFYVVDGELRTPTLDERLPGRRDPRARPRVVRRQRRSTSRCEVIEQASEAFLVSTTRDVQGDHRWDDRELPTPGPITAECARDVGAAREAETMDPVNWSRDSSLDPAIAERLRHTPEGLVPVVVQQHGTGEVLMLGWVDDEALARTLTPGGRRTGPAPARSTGSRATPPVTSSTSARSASTATATPSSSWSTRSARRATPATAPASTPTSSRSASMAEARRTFGPVVLLGLASAGARGRRRDESLGRPDGHQLVQQRFHELHPRDRRAPGRCPSRPHSASWSSRAGGSCS